MGRAARRFRAAARLRTLLSASAGVPFTFLVRSASPGRPVLRACWERRGYSTEGQNRPLDPLHLVFFAALRVKISEEVHAPKLVARPQVRGRLPPRDLGRFQAQRLISRWFAFCDKGRPHSALGGLHPSRGM